MNVNVYYLRFLHTSQTTRWVSDLAKFNEWMNEDDYLVEMPVMDQSLSDTVIAIAVDAPATMQKPSRAAKLETNESAVRVY